MEKTSRKGIAFLITPVSLVLIGIAVCGTPTLAQEKRPTAREVIAAIQEHVAVPWKTETVDTFKAGNPETRVTGIAVTMMATLDVLQRAAAKGENLVITHEPTFYNHLDRPSGMEESDAVWKEKREFIEKNGMVVWRFHDHWHLRNPDGILAGVVQALGWSKFQNAENPHLFNSAGNHARKAGNGSGKTAGFAGFARGGKPGDEGNEAGAEPGVGGIRTGDACAGDGKR